MTLHPSWDLHRDELLYFAMADHFDLFRMQFPPLIAAVAGAGRMLFGESVMAARVPAALAGAALTTVVLWLVRRLGGGVAAIVLAWCGMLAAPVFVRSSVLMQPVIFDQLWATLAIAALVAAAHEKQPRWWLVVGVALGLGVLTKFSVAFVAASLLACALAVGVLRQQLTTRWPWIGAVIASAIAMPAITGQIVNGWPFLQQMQTLRAGQLQHVSRIAFLTEQPALLSGALFCVIAAVWSAWRGDLAARVASLIAACMLTLLCVMRGKAYYAAPVYPAMIAVGAVALAHAADQRAWIVRNAAGVMLVAAVMLWPVGVPVFNAEMTARYFAALGLTQRTNRGEALPLPQDFADMTGWRAMAAAVHDAVMQLPAAARSDVTVIGGNYGEAGALAFYRASFRYPYPRSTAGDFWAWGPGAATGEHVVVLGSAATAGAALHALYDTVAVVRQVRNPRGVREEQDVSVFCAHHARVPLPAVWAKAGPNWH